MIAVDTNVLVYAHRREAAEHERAFELLRSHAEGSAAWAIPWPCVYEFFSVVTNPRMIHDARIAALCVAHGVESLFTRDRDFALFPELPTRDPFA
jgi:uncharacterized protein